MEFRWPPGSAPFPPARFAHPRDGFACTPGMQGKHGQNRELVSSHTPYGARVPDALRAAGPLPPPPLREHIIREAVTRRLTEEWALGDLAFARRLSEGSGPTLLRPDLLTPPPHAPMPMHPLPHAPFEGFGACQWQGPGPRRHAGFGGRTPFPRAEKRRASPPQPDPKRKVKLPEIEPSGTPEALSPKVAMMKRKADANAATTVPKKVQKLAEDWSCSLCQNLKLSSCVPLLFLSSPSNPSYRSVSSLQRLTSVAVAPIACLSINPSPSFAPRRSMEFRFRVGYHEPPVPGGSPPAWFSHPQGYKTELVRTCPTTPESLALSMQQGLCRRCENTSFTRERRGD
ncbi:hypothetical protein ZWY2020_000630 [Hordeum vulgare]|nr:hypothetical protein ZWY2020_000630 [Hordeum vulgare]